MVRRSGGELVAVAASNVGIACVQGRQHFIASIVAHAHVDVTNGHVVRR
jgi:hypothetical protein